MSHVLPSEEVRLAPLGQLRLDSVPTGQGLYIFLDRATQQVLYVGESDNLRRRLQKHVEHSDKRELAQWLWQHGTAGIMVEYHVLPSSTGTRARRALEAEMIGSRNPVFNVLGR